jgi:hypothetical protein
MLFGMTKPIFLHKNKQEKKLKFGFASPNNINYLNNNTYLYIMVVLCETCTLVFHVSCVRPSLTLPLESWSCPHCVLEDLAPGNKAAAKKGIRIMNRLCSNHEAEAENVG